MASRCTIINFHGIGTPRSDLPEDEWPYWINSEMYEGILDRICHLRSTDHEILVTFDDGNLSDIELGFPGLQERGLSARFFILTGRIGLPHYLNAGHIAALREAGMKIGLHGRDHIDWRQADDSRLVAETREARYLLEEAAGAKVTEVGIPFGAYDRRVIVWLNNEGFEGIYTSDGGQAHLKHRVRSRTSVRRDMTVDRIESILCGRFPIRQRVRRFASKTIRQRLR